jgi:flagellar hook protein FlgE
MLSSFFSGISGLISNSQSINVVGNNIANVNTIGFKSSRATFEDVLYQSIFGTSGTSQVGRGTALASVDTLFTQGSFESTSVPTDLAIGGKGFFIVRSPENGTEAYTRAGQFRFDKDGNMTTPSGYVLQGKVIERTSGTATGVPVDIVISPEPSEPRQTSIVDMVTNLQSNATSTAKAGDVTNSTTGPIGSITVSEGKYPWSGDYSAEYVAIAANLITHTGTDAPSGTLVGTITINDKEITLADAVPAGALDGVITLADVIANINAQTATTHVVASATDGKLTLTSNTAGMDVVVSTNLSSGNLGWSTADVASSDLFGTQLTLTVPRVPEATEQTYVGRVGGSRTLADWEGSGLDITTNAGTNHILPAATAQAFDVRGFVYKDEDVTTLVNPGSTSNYQSSITVYDSLGTPHVATVYFRKMFEGEISGAPTSRWEWNAVVDGADWSYGLDESKEAYHLVGTGYLDFNNNGVLINGGDQQELTFDFAGAGEGQTISFNFGANSGSGATTQYPIASTTNYQSQDGYAPGVLESVTVSQDGIISGHYSNGQILDLYEITLADFNNEQGLTREGGNLFSATLESGNARTSSAGENGLGKINPNSLEQSNVDLATEFVKMIVAQRGFQANSRVITTTDEILQELMNIKR